MRHFAMITPPVPGHIHPFGALGRELIERGHRVTVFHMPDLEERIRKESLEFVAIGGQDHPPGSLPLSLAELGKRSGTAALRFTIQAVTKTTEMLLRDAPDAMRAAGITSIIADQMEPAGCAIAEHLGIPFVTVCNALALNREPSVPPPFSPWGYRDSRVARIRNRIGYAVGDHMTAPIRKPVARYRQAWGLRPHRSPEDSFSPYAQISQLTREFDFPRRDLPRTFHYTGPLRRPGGAAVPFPWERLDGRPLVYASLGTLQNNRADVFRCFADACEGLNVQLVMTHGGPFEPDARAIDVSYAPQLELLRRACLTLTHAGLNTVLDTLSCGVPMIAIPITYEQPAIAERVKRSGAGEVLAFAELSARRLRPLIEKMLSDEGHRIRAAKMAESIRSAGGVKVAADIVTGIE